MEHGALSVITDGTTMMHVWSADSWDFLHSVRLMFSLKTVEL